MLVNSPITGMEQIQRAAWFVLIDNLNTTIDDMSAFMQPSDEAVALRKGVDFVPTAVERIPDVNFHEGHRPSLMEAPIENYPNCSVWAVRATPGVASEQYDQASVYRDLIFVEIMVKSELDEEEVNRRVHRTAEAVNITLMRNQTLNGSVSGLDATPTVNISEVFTRKERTAYGQKWFWQGARLEYAVRKEAVHPSSSTGSIFRTGNPDYANIDQA